MTTITRTTFSPGWDAGARSIATFSEDGGASFQVGQCIGIICGLNTLDEGVDYREIEHAFFVESGHYRIIESGELKTSSASFAHDAVFKIERRRGVVRYLIDDATVYTSLVESSGALFVDCSLYFYLDRIIDLQVYDLDFNEVAGSFERVAGSLIESGIEVLRGNLKQMTGSLSMTESAYLVGDLSQLVGKLLESGLSSLRGSFDAMSGALDEVALTPQYDRIFAYLEPVSGKLTEYYDRNVIQGSFEPVVGKLIESGISSLLGAFSPMTGTIWTALPNQMFLVWPKWTIGFVGVADGYALHEAIYGSSQSALHLAAYRIGDLRARLHSTGWTTLSAAYHSVLYEVVLESDSTSDHRLHESIYSVIGADPATSATRIHDVSYSGSSVAISSSSASNIVSYSVFVPARRLHEAIYKSVVLGQRLHATSWRADTDTKFARIHETRYRTSDTSAIIDAGTITVGDGNLRAYDFLDISITADENSPYWQCEMTLKDARDYVRFPRDAPFVIRLFGVDFNFIVDSRTLSRSIDDSGNYLETCTIGGLSPLVAKARPRASRITETWETPALASSIVEDLIGPVTWNLVDWNIPAYRLAAERADPLEVAKQVVTAVGGLIESRPDGNVVCRHLWPTSIAALGSATVDHTLDERVIYAASESPTQDELIDRVRVYDGEAAFQDRLEYVPDKIGESDDPRHGTLYAFVSPWREGMRIVTTRPSKISVGTATEGTRIIGDANEDYPAETVTFSERTGSTQYPIMALTALDWLDENLGSATVTPYATTIDAGDGSYGGYSLAKVQYVARYLSVPVSCVETVEEIEAQFLLLENQNA